MNLTWGAMLQELAVIPEMACITRIDADQHEAVGAVASGAGEVTALALWIMAESRKVGSPTAGRIRSLTTYQP